MPSEHKQLPRKVSSNEWLVERRAITRKEQKFALRRKALIAEWSEMPRFEIDKDHVFEGPNGKVRLIDLFDGRSQLLVYHFWFQPGKEPCEGCSIWTYDLGDLGGDFANLHKHDTSLVFVSRASSNEIEEVKKKRRWTMPWLTMVNDDFDDVTGYGGWAQISVFVREGKKAYLTNIVAFDDLTTIGNHWTLLDRTPFGVGR